MFNASDESMAYCITGDYIVMRNSGYKYAWKCATSTNHRDLATTPFENKCQEKKKGGEWLLRYPLIARGRDIDEWGGERQKKSKEGEKKTNGKKSPPTITTKGDNTRR